MNSISLKTNSAVNIKCINFYRFGEDINNWCVTYRLWQLRGIWSFDGKIR